MTGILTNGVTGLLAFQNALNTTGHNIANSDTPGYSRQRTHLATQTPQFAGGYWMGNGVKVQATERQYDQFLATQTRSTQSAASELQVFSGHAASIDNLLSDPDVGLDPAVQRFFDAMQFFADDPTSIPSRQLLLTESQSMVNRFHDLGGQLKEMGDQLNQQLASVTTEINGYAQALMKVNNDIVNAGGGAGGATPNDLLDQRETLLNELSKLIDINTVPQDDGAMNVFIGRGQPLVLGITSATLATSRGTIDPNQHEVILKNKLGDQVVTDQLAGGEIGGLVGFRKQILNPSENRLGLIAVGFSDSFNTQHQLGLDLNSDVGGPLFGEPVVAVSRDTTNYSGSTLSVSGAFTDTGNLTASDYVLQANDSAGNFTLIRLTDGKEWPIATGGAPYNTDFVSEDGFRLNLDSGAAGARFGDRFLIRPTGNGAVNLSLEINDPRKFAAASPLRSEAGSNLGNGTISPPSAKDTSSLNNATNISLVFDAENNRFQTDVDLDGDGNLDTLDYDPAIHSTGRTYSLTGGHGDPEFTVSGTPEHGDLFRIKFNQDGIGDNRNGLALARLQQTKTLFGDASAVGNETATLQDAYGLLVSDVGSRTRTAQINTKASDSLLERNQMTMSSISGVNLDEEAANLIRYQQAYQASAQVISVAGTVFDSLISAVRG
ncbi:MAG: flagellar hook-associated protein FlgK [Gammaproteobacteria bacterium]|nr:flagellar hook-associated protein FlgK [Gammaproteobacteria bacterium]